MHQSTSIFRRCPCSAEGADSPLPLRRLVVADLAALFHGARREHSCERNVALLNQNISHCLGAVLAEPLVQRHGARATYPFTSIM